MQIITITAALVVCGLSGYSGGTRPETLASATPPQTRDQLLRTFAKEFVVIQPGTGKFPKPPAPIGRFEINKYETTQDLYAAVMGRNPSRWTGTRNSVESMSYSEAVAFCRRVTILLRNSKLIGVDEEIRLPTETEWEYACRAGTTTLYSFGNKATTPNDENPKARLLDAYAWHHGNAAGNDPAVGILKPNAWGLYDMHGYLWEYVSDPWRARPGDADAKELPGSTQRTMRGGSWRDHYSQLTSSTRWAIPDHVRSDAIGFRCVRAKVSARK